MNLIEFLSTVPDFSAMSYSELEVLEKSMAVNNFPDGHVFIQQGKVGKNMHLVMGGKVNITHHSAGNPETHILETLEPGDIFGVQTFITNNKSLESYVADGPVTTASLPKPAFDLLYESKSTLAHHFQHIISRQLTRNYRNIISVLRRVIFSPAGTVSANNLESMIWQYRNRDRRQASDRRKPRDRRD